MENFSRRKFINGGSLAVLSLGAVSTISLEGCSTSSVINEINVVLQEAAAVLAVAEPGAAWVGELQKAIAALMSAEQQWQTGSTVQLVIDALNTIVAITAVIPLTATYSPLIDILVAGIEAVLAALPASTSLKLAVENNPHVGRVKIQRHWYHTPATDFRDTWNTTAKERGLISAVIK